MASLQFKMFLVSLGAFLAISGVTGAPWEPKAAGN